MKQPYYVKRQSFVSLSNICREVSWIGLGLGFIIDVASIHSHIKWYQLVLVAWSAEKRKLHSCIRINYVVQQLRK